MSIEMARGVLLWCTVVNFGVLAIWFVLYSLPHAWLYRFWGRWFRVTAEQFDTLNFAGIVLYKVGILLLNLAPFAALYIVG
jgi:hypothetical protein